MGGWNPSGALVFDGTTPISWTTLDLTVDTSLVLTGLPSTVQSWAMLKVEAGAGFPDIAFRPRTSGYDTYVPVSGGHGCVMVKPNSASSDIAMVLCPTHSDGQIEWVASIAAGSTKIWLAGYIVPVYANDLVYSGTLTSGWHDLDLTVDTGASPTGVTGDTLVYLWYEKTGGIVTNNDITVRPDGENLTLSAGSLGGINHGKPYSIGDVEGYLVKTDSSGVIEHQRAAADVDLDVTLSSYIEAGFITADIEVFPAGTPPIVWTSLDLSSIVDASRTLVMIEVHMEDIYPGSITGAAFRASDDTGDYLNGLNYPIGVACCGIKEDERTYCLVETGADGVIEWVASSALRDIDLRLVGYIPIYEGPQLTNQYPTGVATTLDEIRFTINDAVGIIMSTLVVSALSPKGETLTIYTGSAFQTGWNGQVLELEKIDGTNPTIVEFKIQEWPATFDVGYPIRWTMQVDVSTTPGGSL